MNEEEFHVPPEIGPAAQPITQSLDDLRQEIIMGARADFLRREEEIEAERRHLRNLLIDLRERYRSLDSALWTKRLIAGLLGAAMGFVGFLMILEKGGFRERDREHHRRNRRRSV